MRVASALNSQGGPGDSQLGVRVRTAVLVVAAAAAMIGALAIERGNRPYTANFRTDADNIFGVALFCVTVLGAVLLALRRSHPTGLLIVGSGLLLGLGLLCHGAAVRLRLVNEAHGTFVDIPTWLAPWLVVPGLGLLPFALATWPDGRIEARWLRRILPIAAAGLALATIAQAFAPDRLDGVAGSYRIDNPYGISVADGKGDDPWWSIPIGIAGSALALLICALLTNWRLRRTSRA